MGESDTHCHFRHHLDGGPAAVSIPKRITKTDFEDLCAWFDFLRITLERRMKAQEPDEPA